MGFARLRTLSVLGLTVISVAAGLAILFAASAVRAQASPWQSVVMRGNHPAEVGNLTPVGHADPNLQMKMEVTLALRNQAQLDQLLHEQQDPASPHYQQWLTPRQFADRFGPSRQDLEAVESWLTSEGLHVTAASLEGRYVRFTGRLIDVEHAFGVNIMAYGNGSAFANVLDPAVPARFAGVIGSINGLSNFLHSRAMLRAADSPSSDAIASGPPLTQLVLFDPGKVAPLPSSVPISPLPDYRLGGVTAFGPADLRTFYNENPLLATGITGVLGSDCIAIVGDSDYTHGAVSLFNSNFGLPSSSITTVLVDGTNPGITGDEDEALLDLEWSHVTAPGPPIRFYLGDNSHSSANGSIVDAIQRAVSDNKCGVISVSFSLCGGSKTFFTGTISPIYAQAASQGQSIFISSGDDGAAGVIFNPAHFACETGTSRNINELGGDPNATQVGGTKFNPIYDAAGNDVGHVAEQVWNDEASDGGGATGGGASMYYTKPSYQKGPGVPGDGKRDVPDISLIASNFHPGVFLGFDNHGTPAIGCCIGGTSLSAPAWAGFARLIMQIQAKRLGNPNPRIYQLAGAGLSASGFRDVTSGNNDFNGVAGYPAHAGFDLSTGWGTVDIGKFANKFAGASPTPTPTPTRTPTPTHTPTPAPTPGPPPVISSIPSAIQVGGSFSIVGSHFSAGAMVNFFVSTAGGSVNAGPLSPSAVSSTALTVPVPVDVPLGQGFVTVQVVNTDQGFKTSNVASALLRGSAAAGIPTLTKINGVGLAATSADPSFAADNVETVVPLGTSVTLGGTGFDATNGVAINVFCACPGGKVGPFFVNPGGSLTATSVMFNLPSSGANAPAIGPGSFVVINKGSGSFARSSNAVSAPIGEALAVTSVSQVGSIITVNGSGFSTLTVINFFNLQGATAVNLGGLSGGAPEIPLTIVNSTKFTFTKPAGSVAGASYVQAINPPFVPFTSSGDGPGGAFTLK